jgi:pyridoxamine 5'-phosphate oxidase
MTLATSSRGGHVTARMVLLKQHGTEGFTFFTNYDSRKGKQLSENSRAALVFYWPYLMRQIRIEGVVEPVSHEESVAYFHSRPRLSQFAAVVSKQSEVITSRQELISAFKELRRKTGRNEVNLPPHWGGYRLIPDTFEFWHGRKNRLHDRLRYRKKKDGTWLMELLAP